ncbi:hypothetical protein EJD97_008690 [Solanum chilense]|uniref:Uncharacterized protein n=1 Tax=Solanum chilense TaxID=4083 RepID=A0A6N2C9Y6_SOLCI|nr:hypothetical protein EJD97_008690 [Solanum chilense]
MCGGDRLKNQAEAFEEMISEIPFRYCVGESEISIFNRGPETKPDTIFSGSKRKVITLIEEVPDNPSLSDALVKNVTGHIVRYVLQVKID